VSGALAKTEPSDAELWRRLVWWSQASDAMVGGCAGGCMLAVAAFAIDVAFGPPHAVHVLVAIAGLGGVLEGLRRACEAGRRRALEAAAARLLSSRGMSREAVEQAAARLRSGRIEELDASLAFDSDPFHCAIEGVFGRAGVSLAPLCEEAEGARTVVVGLGPRWAAALRFVGDELRDAHVHERHFAWNEGAGPRRIELPLDVEAHARLERSIGALARSPSAMEPAASADLRADGTLAIKITIVEGAARRDILGEVGLAGAALARVDRRGGGPYRAITRMGEPANAEGAVVEIEEKRHALAASPRDEAAPNVFAHVILQSAARVVVPLVLVERVLVEHGRPLRIDGEPRFAGTERSAAWIEAVADVPELDGARRAEVSAKWLRAALEEHSSIFAFARIARVLSDLGAPDELVDRSRSAMEDEVRHARDAFSLAAAYGGEMVGPGPLEVPDGPPPSIDALAIETFFDGCVGETLAARQAAAALERCRVRAAREALARVAIDERRHAELAWDTLAWLLPRASAQARAVIAGATAPKEASEQGHGEWLAAHGWLTSGAERAIAAWGDEIGPRRDALLARCGKTFPKIGQGLGAFW
jgi:hypothetical protein